MPHTATQRVRSGVQSDAQCDTCERSCSVVLVQACRRRPGRAAETRLELFVIIELHWVSVLGKS
jgi:hypothetical protein